MYKPAPSPYGPVANPNGELVLNTGLTTSGVVALSHPTEDNFSITVASGTSFPIPFGFTATLSNAIFNVDDTPNSADNI